MFMSKSELVVSDFVELWNNLENGLPKLVVRSEACVSDSVNKSVLRIEVSFSSIVHFGFCLINDVYHSMR